MLKLLAALRVSIRFFRERLDLKLVFPLFDAKYYINIMLWAFGMEMTGAKSLALYPDLPAETLRFGPLLASLSLSLSLSLNTAIKHPFSHICPGFIHIQTNGRTDFVVYSLSLPPTGGSMTDNANPKMGYRSDIDGLRALAVLAVVGYHAFPDILKGGFVGVDIFFVISGFLISGIILDDLAKEKFSFLTFYARRIRRIFPALFLVLCTVLVSGWFSLYPDEYQLLGKHVFGGAAFLSNIFFWREVGYFDVASSVKPLLHLWSLGIEEQFYIIFPCLLVFTWKKRFRPLTVIVLILGVSFFFNAHLYRRNPIADFYSPYTRFWELLAGVVVATLDRQPVYFISKIKTTIDAFCEKLLFLDSVDNNGRTFSSLVSIFGIILLLFAIFTTRITQHFPGFRALLPTLGTVCLIASSSQAWGNRVFFSNKAMVTIGLISYPLYLWHWPFLSYAHIMDGGLSGTWSWFFVRIICVIFATMLAILTYRYVERPIRFGQRAKNLKVFSLLCLVFCIGASGLTVYLKKGLPQRSFSATDFVERAAVRKKIQTTFAFISYILPQDFHKAFIGNDGWLFLGNDYDSCLDKLTGEISPAITAHSESSSSSIIALLKQYDGIKKIIFIGPNKSTIYPEHLPTDIRPSSHRYISPILQKFQESGIDVFDPTEVLLKAKNDKLLYYRTDTHWNNFGAYLAVQGLLMHLDFTPEMIDKAFGNLDFTSGPPHNGDLINIGKFELKAVAGDNFVPVWRLPHGDLTLIESNGAQKSLPSLASVGPGLDTPIRIMNPNAAGNLKVWIFGDSFSVAASPFFNAMFAETLYLHRGSKSLLLEGSPPDLIIYEGVERDF
ncbi:MAG: acyltransferase family protein [Desulfovibrio sp.]|nr:acyltransferase family protein [Desulfovibrio sp.]